LAFAGIVCPFFYYDLPLVSPLLLYSSQSSYGRKYIYAFDYQK
jgi:hypothetical protein